MAQKSDRNATLVGLFLFIGLGCLGLMVAQFSNISGKFKGDYQVNVIFADASGLVKYSDVTYGGAKVGRVITSPKMQEDTSVIVTLNIKGGVTIPKGSELSIFAVSLLGDKGVAIKVPENPSADIYQDGDTIQGLSGGGIDGIASQAQEMATNANAAIKDFRRMAGKLDASIEGFDLMLEELTTTLVSINSGVLSPENTKAIQLTLKNIELSSKAIKQTSEELQPILAKVDPIFTEAQDTVAAVKKATKTAEGTFAIASDQIDALGPALKELPETLKNLREASAKATAMMSKVSGIADDAKEVVANVKNGDGLISSLSEDKGLKEDTKTFVKNLKQYGILRYRDAETKEDEPEDPKRSRFRGGRR